MNTAMPKTIKVFVPVLVRTNKNAIRKGFRVACREYLPERDSSGLPRDDFAAVVFFHFPGKATGDIDNLLKPTLDVVKGSLIYDDGQIKEIHAYLNEHDSKTGFTIELTPIPARKPVNPTQPPIPPQSLKMAPKRVKTPIRPNAPKKRKFEPAPLLDGKKAHMGPYGLYIPAKREAAIPIPQSPDLQ